MRRGTYGVVISTSSPHLSHDRDEKGRASVVQRLVVKLVYTWSSVHGSLFKYGAAGLFVPADRLGLQFTALASVVMCMPRDIRACRLRAPAFFEHGCDLGRGGALRVPVA